MKRDFSLGAALSVTTGRCCADIGEIQRLVEHILDRQVLTHELGGQMRVARQPLFEQHPWLSGLVPPAQARTKASVQGYLQMMIDAGLPATVSVRPRR